MPDRVSLVIPGRNCAATIASCLDAVVPTLSRPDARLDEIIFVDDGSTDATPDLVAARPVTLVTGRGTGPGAARNLGWRTARNPLVWFVDSDCLAEPDALALLVPHLEDPRVAAVSGSYGNMRPHELLPTLIHEEIVERHNAMPVSVNFLATFNVLYRRAVLEELDGFNERYLKGQDAELSFRAKEAGHALHFEPRSRVGHYHEDRWLRYLRTQRQQGYWRVWLHLEHRGHSGGDSYSSLADHLQPPVALGAVGALPLVALPLFPGVGLLRWLAILPAGLAVALALLQLPLTVRIVRRTGRWSMAVFAGMSFVRAFWRAAGMAQGMVGYALRSR